MPKSKAKSKSRAKTKAKAKAKAASDDDMEKIGTTAAEPETAAETSAAPSKPAAASPEEHTQPEMPGEADAYLVDLRAAEVSGRYKLVDFKGGIGLLTIEALQTARPDWFRGGRRLKGLPLSEYARYWHDRGALVTPLTAKEAQALTSIISKGDPLPEQYGPSADVSEGDDEHVDDDE